MQLQARLTFQVGAERGSLMQLARLEYEEKEKKEKRRQNYNAGKEPSRTIPVVFH